MTYQAVGRKTIAIAAILMVVAVTAILSFSWGREQEINAVREESENQLDIAALELFGQFDKYDYLPKLLSNYQFVTNALLHPKDPAHIREANALLERLNTEAGSALIYVMNLDGLTIASSNWNRPDSLVGNDYSFRPYFVNARRTGEGRFYAMGITTKVPGYYISTLIKKDNIALGVIAVKIDIRDLHLRRAKNNREIIVTDKNGVIFLSSKPEWKYRPIWSFTALTREELKRTRQYEGVLEEALPVARIQNLRPGEQIVDIAEQKNRSDGGEQISYFVKSHSLPDSEWRIHILTPMDKVDEQATWAAVIAVGAVALVILSFMYLNQIRARNRERNESRLALEQAHKVLEQKHGELQALMNNFMSSRSPIR